MKTAQSLMTKAFEQIGIKPWLKYIEYLLRAKQTGALDLDAFIEAYGKTEDGKKAYHTPEELCEISGTPPRVIIGHIAGQLWELAHSESDMLLALNHVEIVRTAIEQAKTPGGFRDREALMKANGVLPIPTTQSLHLHRHFAAPKTIEGGRTDRLPDFEAYLSEIEDDLPPLLPAGK